MPDYLVPLSRGVFDGPSGRLYLIRSDLDKVTAQFTGINHGSSFLPVTGKAGKLCSMEIIDNN